MQNATGNIEATARVHPQSNLAVKVLILDDNTFDRQRLRRLAQDTMLSMDLVEATSITGLPVILDTDRFDVILIDYVLAPGNGLEALEIVRNHAVNHCSAVIMVTGDDRSDVAVRALQNGCADYIAKNRLTAPDLRRRLLRAIGSETGPLSHALTVGPEPGGHAKQALRDYADALQPQLAHVIRDMRALRVRAAATGSDMSAELHRIERQCLGIWGILLDPPSGAEGIERCH